MRCNDVSGPLSNKVQGGYNEAGSAPPSVNHAAEAALALVLVTHCMSGTWGKWSIFSIYQTSLFTGGVSPPSRQDRAGPGARWKCLIRSHKGSGECGVYCLNRDTARCWSALYGPLPGQGHKHVNMNEYTAPPPAACSITLPGYSDSPPACPVCKMLQHTCSGGLLSVLSMSSGGGCSTVSPPVSLFIFTVFCGRKYPSRTQWLENATISFCCELLSSLMNAVKDHWGAGGLAGPRRGDPAAVMVL